MNLKAATLIIEMSQDYWPLKIALFQFIIQAYMESGDPNFMRRPTDEEKAEQEDEAQES